MSDVPSKYIIGANDELAVSQGCYVDERLGEHVCKFFAGYLCHSKGEWRGKPFILAPCQVDDIVMPLFSWVRADGTRRFRAAQIWVAKKNFKSTFASGLALYLLVADGEGGPEVYCAANSREQADIVFREAAAMVEASPELQAILTVNRSAKVIREGHSGWIRALSSESSTAEGLNGSVIVDELHAFNSKARDFYDALKYAGAARQQPLNVVISTAGEEENNIGREVYDYGKSVLSGATEDTKTFVYIAEPDPGDDPGDVETWRKANPMMGITVQESELREMWEEDRQTVRTTSRFRRYRCNQWVKAVDPWLDIEAWDECRGDITPESLEGRTCGAGLDLATKKDLTALALCFPLDDGFFAFLLKFWLPIADIVKREKRDRCAYRDWQAAGFLELTDGNIVDIPRIEAYIASLSDKYNICEFGYDPWNATDLGQRLQDKHGLTVVEVGQGIATMTEPSKAYEALILDRKMIHFGNPVLRQQAQQVCVKTDSNGNIKPIRSDDKGKRWYRIDGIVGSVMALGRAMSGSDDAGLITLAD